MLIIACLQGFGVYYGVWSATASCPQTCLLPAASLLPGAGGRRPSSLNRLYFDFTYKSNEQRQSRFILRFRVLTWLSFSYFLGAGRWVRLTTVLAGYRLILGTA